VVAETSRRRRLSPPLGSKMKKRNKIILLIISHSVIAAIFFSLALLTRISKDSYGLIENSNKMLNDMALISRYSAFVDVQRHNDYPNGYKEALLLFSKALDQSKELNSPMFSKKAYFVDKAMVNERLSKLAHEAGDSKQADQYMTKAQEFCKQSGWSDCSEEHLAKVSEIIEKNSLFARKPEGT